MGFPLWDNGSSDYIILLLRFADNVHLVLVLPDRVNLSLWGLVPVGSGLPHIVAGGMRDGRYRFHRPDWRIHLLVQLAASSVDGIAERDLRQLVSKPQMFGNARMGVGRPEVESIIDLEVDTWQ